MLEGRKFVCSVLLVVGEALSDSIYTVIEDGGNGGGRGLYHR